VIKTARAPLKDGDHHHRFGLTGNGGERFRRGAGNGLSQIEKRGVFTLAKILGAKKLRQTNHLRALLGGGANLLFGPAKIVVRVGGAVHLNESYGECVWIRHQLSRELPRMPKLPKIAEIEKPFIPIGGLQLSILAIMAILAIAKTSSRISKAPV
jgi:hypothetical protein